MCGIIGILGKSKVTDRLVNSLQMLEYRGYDSAGIAVINSKKIHLCKTAGKINNLKSLLEKKPIDGNCGIGHTRWATHGAPETRNAHPFITDRIALVHNGIIENYAEIKKELTEEGISFESDTDSEVLLKLIDKHYAQTNDEYEAVFKSLIEIKGAFAVVLIFSSNSNLMIGMRKGAPLAIGIGNGEMYLGSDALALSSYTNKLIYLNDGEIVKLTNNDYKITDSLGQPVTRAPHTIIINSNIAEKGEYAHYMLKEIHEQTEVATHVFSKYYNVIDNKFRFDDIASLLKSCSRIYIIACGTSYHASMVAKYWLEKFANIPTEIDIASEFRYRHAPLDKNAIGIFISQSGETADTLAALRHVKLAGLKTLAIVNVEESSIAHESDFVLPLYAGYEIGVASTKVFTSQLIIMAMLSLCAGNNVNLINDEQLATHIKSLKHLPSLINEVLSLEPQIIDIAENIMSATNMIYIGRSTSYAIALEGALKIKEISYIHAEGIAAGELKHGTIALIDKHMPIVAIAPQDALFSKTVSNIQEINARSGTLIVLTDKKGIIELKLIAKYILELPDCDEIIAPIIYNVALQLLAYHTALKLGQDVDQPRNLAKSVTVE